MTTETKVLGENASTREPVTRTSLIRDLESLGVSTGCVAIVHTSLSNLGWVAGGSQAVIEALISVLGEHGTLMMPAHTAHLTDPKHWKAPPVPEHWWPILRAETPAFDPDITATRSMGVIAETFRKHPGVRRSLHPHVSFAALGPEAARITEDHPEGCMFGERSPLARLYELDGVVLLLGVGHGNNTSIHLGEYRSPYPGKKQIRDGAPIMVDGKRQWVEFEDQQAEDEDFPSLGADFARDTGAERCGKVGWGEGRLMSVRTLVDYAIDWFETHR